MVACLLAPAVAGWTHAAEHAGEAELAAACSACDWAKHSPAVSAAAATVVAQLLVCLAAPIAPIRPDVRAQRAPAVGRAPPAA